LNFTTKIFWIPFGTSFENYAHSLFFFGLVKIAEKDVWYKHFSFYEMFYWHLQFLEKCNWKMGFLAVLIFQCSFMVFSNANLFNVSHLFVKLYKQSRQNKVMIFGFSPITIYGKYKVCFYISISKKYVWNKRTFHEQIKKNLHLS